MSIAQTARMALRAPKAKTAAPIRVPAPALRAAQAAKAVPVSRTSDPAEREAERVARQVVQMPASASAPQARRFAGVLPSATARAPAATSPLPAAMGLGSSTGQPLPRRVRREMEPRFQADFSQVRVHTGEVAARASRRLNAAAFTAGRDVFFGRGAFAPDAPAGRQLLAHELTHTIQQGAAAQTTVHRSVDTTVRERAAPQTVHRLGIQDALDFFADKAAWIPGFSLLALLLGFNPVSLRAVPRTAANLLRALVQLIPGGPLITQALDNHGIVDKVAAWADGQLSALGDIGSAIRQSIDEFLDGLSWTDIFDLDGVWSRAKRIVTGPIDRIIAFGSGLVGGIITFIKDAILRPIAALIEPTRGYPLLKAVLGFDPVTGDAVPRTLASLLGGFMTLIGQDEVWQNIQQGNAIGQAYAWFQGAMSGLMGIVTAIPGTFLAAFQSLQLVDIILVPRAFARIIGVFGSIAGQFLSWGLGTVIKLLEIIFSVVAPGAMGTLRRAGGAIAGIFRNPIGFVMNLVRAAKAGFQRFGRNLLRHLQTSLISWLTGSLPGVYIPQGLNLPEILKFVLSVLGLSWANIRQKLVTAVGEPAVRAMEMGFDLVVTLVRDGPAAAWAQMQEQLANLKQMAIDGIIGMVVNLVMTRAVPRLVAMFIPGAGFISAIVSIYGTVTTFIAQLSRIAQVITSFLDSMMAIAAGNIEAAAARVETTLAGLLTLAINFLAGFAGLGRVADQVRGVIARIRAPIDRALDSVVAWIARMAKGFVQKAKAGAKALLNWWRKKVPVNAGGQRHTLTFDGSSARSARLVLRSTPQLPSGFLSEQADRNTTIKGAKRSKPITTAATQEAAIGALQLQLAAYDDNNSPAVTGKPMKAAQAAAVDMDNKLGVLATHIVGTLIDWKLADGDVASFSLPRGKFTLQQKFDVAKGHAAKGELKPDSKGNLVNLATRDGRALARRHVVSSFDISKHYSQALTKKKWSEAKLLLEQRGSIVLAKTAVVGALSQASIEAAAKQRYQAFFGYAQNLFIGDSAENSSIQEELDRGNPAMADKKLAAHVTRIKRSWAIDNSIQISGLDE